MATTQQRITFAMTKADLEMLDKLCQRQNETRSQIIRRALQLFYQITFIKNEEHK